MDQKREDQRAGRQMDLVRLKVSHSHVFDWSSTIFAHSNVSPDVRPRSQSSTSCECHAAWMRREIPWVSRGFQFAALEDWEKVKTLRFSKIVEHLRTSSLLRYRGSSQISVHKWIVSCSPVTVDTSETQIGRLSNSSEIRHGRIKCIMCS